MINGLQLTRGAQTLEGQMGQGAAAAPVGAGGGQALVTLGPHIPGQGGCRGRPNVY